MAKINMKEVNEAYVRGLNAALRLCRDGGPEKIEDELRFRGVNNFNLPVLRSEFLKWGDEAWSIMMNNTKATVEAMSILVLLDEFDFSRDMILKFMDRYELKTGSLLTDELVDWQTYENIIKEELNIDFTIPVAHDTNIENLAEMKANATEKDFEQMDKQVKDFWDKYRGIWGTIAGYREYSRKLNQFVDLVTDEILSIKGIGEKKRGEIHDAVMKITSIVEC